MRFYNNLPHQTWTLIARNQFFLRVETLYNIVVRFDGVREFTQLAIFFLFLHIRQNDVSLKRGRDRDIFCLKNNWD